MLNHLNRLYTQYNRREYVHPDPLEFLYLYDHREDREVAGLIASCLAYGKVRQILKSVSSVLDVMEPSPYSYLAETPEEEIKSTYQSFVHRFAKGYHLASLLLALKHVIKKYGSVYECFLDGFSNADENILPALTQFIKKLRDSADGEGPGHLLASPENKSACKRLNLFLRWMVRNDQVDPGGWKEIPASKLLVPLDIHMFRISRALGITSRNQANLLTAIEITENFKKWIPDDPVRFDFALTRFGIRDDLNIDDIFGLC